VSDATTQDIRVFAPDSEGRWPVVLALHGIGGSSQDVAELATRLAGTGAVVFAPTHGLLGGYLQRRRGHHHAHHFHAAGEEVELS